MNVAIIPARGGSTRILRKNIKLFHGRPIIAYSIATALESKLFDSVIVSTEDAEIAMVARSYGAETVARPEFLTQDEYGPLDVARHTISQMSGVSFVCVIYATAPLMSVGDLVRGYREMGRNGVAYAVSIGLDPLHDAAQFFWCRARALRDHVPEFAELTAMVPIAAERDCDINTPMDWARAELMYTELYGEVHVKAN